MENRIGWLDASRGLCFFCVVYFHLSTSNPVIQSCFTPFFVSFFFFVSGYLFKPNQPFLKVLEQRTRTIFIPFFIFGFFGSLVKYYLEGLNFTEVITESFKNVMWQDKASHHNALWFLASLYLYSLVFYFVMKLVRGRKSAIVVAAALFLGNYVYMYVLEGPYTPWHLEKMGFGCFFLLVGNLYRLYEKDLSPYVNGRNCIIAFVIYCLVLYLNNFKYVDFCSSKLLLDSLVLYVTSYVAILYLSKTVLAKSRFLLFIGSNSLAYFALHRVVMTLVEKLLLPYETPLFVNDFSMLLVSLINVLLILVGLMLPMWIINRYMPWLLGRGFHLWTTE